MKLKELLNYIKTNTKIRIATNDGEEFIPTYADLKEYEDYYVLEFKPEDKETITILITSVLEL